MQPANEVIASPTVSRPAKPAERAPRFSALRNRNFTYLLAGLIVSNTGSWMQTVAQGWLLYNLTDSPLYLGLLGFTYGVPMIVLPPIGGVVADRLPRLKLLKFTQISSAVLAALLGVLVSFGAVQPWHLLAFSFLMASVNAIDNPTRQALLPDLVRTEDMTSAIAINSSVYQGASLFGPTLAGIAISSIGVAGAFYANAVSYFAVVFALFLMHGVPEQSRHDDRQGLFQDFTAGLSYVRSVPLLLALLSLAAVTGIFGRSYQQLLPVFARDILDVGTTGFGLMMSAPGAGALAAAVILSAAGDFKGKGIALLGGILVSCGALIFFALSKSFPLSLALLFLIGLTNMGFRTIMTILLQLSTPAQMRGRVMSLLTVTTQGLTPLGALLTGALAAIISTPEAIVFSSVALAVTAVVIMAKAPTVRASR